MRIPGLLTLAGIETLTAAQLAIDVVYAEDALCKAVSENLASPQPAVINYCSSLLRVPPIATSTITVTMIASETIARGIRTVFPDHFYSCLSSKDAVRRTDAQRRLSNTIVPKPACFEQYTSQDEISSACGCLGLATRTATTSTLTKTTLPTHAENKPQVVTTASIFSCRTETGKYARVSHRDPRSNSIFVDAESSEHRMTGPTNFTLGDSCALVVSDTGSSHILGHQAMQATNAGTDAVVFEPSTAAGTGYTALLCQILTDSNRLECTVSGRSPTGGYFDNRGAWSLDAEQDLGFGLLAVPVMERAEVPLEQSTKYVSAGNEEQKPLSTISPVTVVDEMAQHVLGPQST